MQTAVIKSSSRYRAPVNHLVVGYEVLYRATIRCEHWREHLAATHTANALPSIIGSFSSTSTLDPASCAVIAAAAPAPPIPQPRRRPCSPSWKECLGVALWLPLRRALLSPVSAMPSRFVVRALFHLPQRRALQLLRRQRLRTAALKVSSPKLLLSIQTPDGLFRSTSS